MSVPQPRIAEADGPSDAELITAVRGGDGDAYGQLYRRHGPSARHLARQLTRSPAEVDDLVSEAFAKVLDTLRGGGGPDTAFRAYLLTTLRNTLYDRVRRDRRLELSDDMSRHDPGVPWVDTAVAGLESSLAARAFARLPERWQTVLWHTEVEQETPAEVAPLLGLTPNGVAALAYRAREGLRQAYLQEHLADVAGDQCRYTVERMGAWARGGLSARERARVDDHLAGCDRCRLLASELEEVNGGLRGILAPLLLGAPLAAAYLVSATPEAAAAAAAAGSAGVAAGTAPAASAGAGTVGAGTAAAGSAGTAGAGAAGAGAGAGAAGAGAAGAGAGAAGAGAAGVAAGGGSVTATGGSVLVNLANWVVGTGAGQAAAAAAAVVVGGAAVGIGLTSGPSGDAQAALSSASAPALPGGKGRGPGVPAPNDPTGPGIGGSPGGSASPGSSGAPDASGSPGGSGPGQGGPGGSATPGESGRPDALPGQSGLPGPQVTPTPAAKPTLDSDGAVSAGPLRQGTSGEISITVRNTGRAAANRLIASVSLPDGLTVAGPTDPEPADLLGVSGWTCDGSGATATCTSPALAPDRSSELRVKVLVAPTAIGGTVSGTVEANDGAVIATIPTTVLTVVAG